MMCPDCSFDNLEGADACEECGNSLVTSEPAGTDLERSIVSHTVDVLCPRSPIRISSETKVRDAISEMVQQGIGCVLVEKDGTVTGIFTERDVLNKVSQDTANLDRPVSEFMTADPETITGQDSIAFALHTMDIGGYRHLPVVDPGGCPGGILSVRDIMRFLCIRYAQTRG